MNFVMSIVRTAGLYNLKKRLFNYDLIKVIRRHGSVSSVKYIYRHISNDTCRLRRYGVLFFVNAI